MTLDQARTVLREAANDYIDVHRDNHGDRDFDERNADRALQRVALAYALVYFVDRGMIRDAVTESWFADKILEDDSLLPEEQ